MTHETMWKRWSSRELSAESAARLGFKVSSSSLFIFCPSSRQTRPAALSELKPSSRHKRTLPVFTSASLRLNSLLIFRKFLFSWRSCEYGRQRFQFHHPQTQTAERIIFIILFIVFNLLFIMYRWILCINFQTFQFIRLKFNFNFIIQNKFTGHCHKNIHKKTKQTTYLKTHKQSKIQNRRRKM